MLAITSSAPAICGTTLGCTKLAASTLATPASASLLHSSARTSGESVLSSFCSPSRGPTSTISTRIRSNPLLPPFPPAPPAPPRRGRSRPRQRVTPVPYRREAPSRTAPSSSPLASVASGPPRPHPPLLPTPLPPSPAWASLGWLHPPPLLPPGPRPAAPVSPASNSVFPERPGCPVHAPRT